MKGKTGLLLAVLLAALTVITACGGGGGGGSDPAPANNTTTYNISGTITSSGTGTSGVTVSLSGASTATATSDASGNYTFTGLANGSYTVTPSMTGYTFNPASSSQTVNSVNITSVNFVGTANAPASLALAMKGTSGNAVNMNGTWKKCTHIVTVHQNGHLDPQDRLSAITVSGGSLSMTISTWSTSTTANCLQTTTPDMIMTESLTATMGAEATATWTNGSGSTLPPTGIASNAIATKATITCQSASFTLGSDVYVKSLNTNAICRKTDWVKGVSNDVLNCTDMIPSTTTTDYFVVDDSASILKLYDQTIGTAPYQVDSINPSLK